MRENVEITSDIFPVTIWGNDFRGHYLFSIKYKSMKYYCMFGLHGPGIEYGIYSESYIKNIQIQYLSNVNITPMSAIELEGYLELPVKCWDIPKGERNFTEILTEEEFAKILVYIYDIKFDSGYERRNP